LPRWADPFRAFASGVFAALIARAWTSGVTTSR
jgi:hypothetical protein